MITCYHHKVDYFHMTISSGVWCSNYSTVLSQQLKKASIIQVPMYGYSKVIMWLYKNNADLLSNQI